MHESKIYSDQERRDRYEQWLTEQAQQRLARLLEKTPAEFRVSGELHPEVLRWASLLLTGDQGPVPNLALIGNVGTGKSWTLWSLARVLLEGGYLKRFEIMPAYRLKQVIAPPADMQIINGLVRADLLALDDIAAIRMSDWDSDHLYSVIDERYVNHRPTILTSNLPNLGDLLGERAASRFAQRAVVVRFTGPDRRRTR